MIPAIVLNYRALCFVRVSYCVNGYYKVGAECANIISHMGKGPYIHIIDTHTHYICFLLSLYANMYEYLLLIIFSDDKQGSNPLRVRDFGLLALYTSFVYLLDVNGIFVIYIILEFM